MKTIINNFLVNAISKDQVKLAYLLLKLGADVNQKILYEYEEYDDHGRSCIEATYEKRQIFISPLDFTDSEAMKRLLKHYGGLPTKAAVSIWMKSEARERELASQREKKEEERRAKKYKSDNRFVDKVIR